MAGKRKHISLKKRCAIFALALGDVPYNEAKQMTEDQIISLYHLDHNMLHSSKVKNTDAYWNYTPRLIAEHRAKTKQDAKIIAKGRRIRKKMVPLTIGVQEVADALSNGFRQGMHDAYDRIKAPLDLYSERYQNIDWSRKTKPKRKIRSRGFDKTRRRKMDGTVEKR